MIFHFFFFFFLVQSTFLRAEDFCWAVFEHEERKKTLHTLAPAGLSALLGFLGFWIFLFLLAWVGLSFCSFYLFVLV